MPTPRPLTLNHGDSVRAGRRRRRSCVISMTMSTKRYCTILLQTARSRKRACNMVSSLAQVVLSSPRVSRLASKFCSRWVVFHFQELILVQMWATLACSLKTYKTAPAGQEAVRSSYQKGIPPKNGEAAKASRTVLNLSCFYVSPNTRRQRLLHMNHGSTIYRPCL